MSSNKEIQDNKSETNIPTKKTYDFFCSRTEWVHCEHHKMTEEEAEKYAKEHNLRYIKKD